MSRRVCCCGSGTPCVTVPPSGADTAINGRVQIGYGRWVDVQRRAEAVRSTPEMDGDGTVTLLVSHEGDPSLWDQLGMLDAACESVRMDLRDVFYDASDDA